MARPIPVQAAAVLTERALAQTRLKREPRLRMTRARRRATAAQPRTVRLPSDGKQITHSPRPPVRLSYNRSQIPIERS